MRRIDELNEFARNRPLLRAKELRAAGFSASTLSSALEAGILERVSRGVYQHASAPWDEHLNLSEVIARVPKAVIVLTSALNFHGIGTHQASAVSILMKQNAVTPRIEYPPIEVIRTSDPRAFTEGVETHDLNGIAVPVTSPARTVADCFKHRSKLGLELCLEALREILGSGTTASEILVFARMDRVEKIMMPYLEAIA